MPLPYIPCIIGPTGAGKTAASLAVAKNWPTTVINADSRQVYADFPRITAQPSAEEQACCPHRLYGFLPTHKKIAAGEYARMALQTIEEERTTHRLPLLVGGTGLYIQTLFEGIAPVPPIPQAIHEYWVNRCTQEKLEVLYKELQQIDPIYAAKIHPNDTQRVTRALEVHAATGKPLSWWHAQPMPKPKYTPVKIGIALTLSELKPILEKRIQVMLAQGALEEALTARTRCDDPTAPGWSGIGCREVYAYLAGTISLEECCALWLKQTRAYAKRQLTWFRRDTGITWFQPHQTQEIVAFLQRTLEG